jgi:hypothetical protein
MSDKFFTALSVIFSLVAIMASAQSSTEMHLPLDANISGIGSEIELNWYDTSKPRVGSVVINRRQLGQHGGDAWQPIGTNLGPVMRFTDDKVQAGVAYEYQVMRVARDIVDVGYWAAGIEIPAIAARGTVYLVVDETMSVDLTAHLNRFERDLIGDGWSVVRHETKRGDLHPKAAQNDLQAALELKDWLKQKYFADPFGQHAVILVGRVPIVLSGHVAPDGHAPSPHASDLFYAEMDGVWRRSPNGYFVENALPSYAIEMQIGRIDFASVSNGNHEQEVGLLRAYLDKNHHWRMGLIGDLRAAYGQSKYLLGEQYGLRNIVGPENIEAGGHHDVGEQKPWLWGVDFGHYDGKIYAAEFSNKAVFSINFGSHKQKIEGRNNPMTALLAQSWYPIAVGWGGRPSWWLHHMALGETIGNSHMRTVNNGRVSEPYRETMDYYPTGTHLFRNSIWVNLLGDPTTRAFMLAPASEVVVTQVELGQRISWAASPDPDVTGYQIWRQNLNTGEWISLDDGQLHEMLYFIDQEPVYGARYMIRAHGLKSVHAGSFYTYSQGAFSADGMLFAADMVLEAIADQPNALPEMFDAPLDGVINAIIEGPEYGTISRSETGMYYIPPTGFTGTVDVRFSVSNAWRTDVGILKINVQHAMSID